MVKNPLRNKRLPSLPPKKKSNVDWDAVNAAKAAREAQRIEREHIQNWTNGNKAFDSTSYMKLWTAAREKSAKGFLELVINTMSTADAVDKTNDSLNIGLSMPDISMSMDDTVQVLDKLFRIRLISVLLEDDKFLAIPVKEEIMHRAVAMEFPLFDYMPEPVKAKPVPPLPPPVKTQTKPPSAPKEQKFRRRRSLSEGISGAIKYRPKEQ